MIEVSLNGIQKYYGATKVLENITFEAKTGERVAIVGRNGTGKTTIFKIIAGIEDYNGGVLSIRKGITIGYLDQIPSFPKEYKVIDVLKTAFEEAYKINNEMRKLEEQMSCVDEDELDKVMKKYGRFQSKFEHLGGYDIEEKISKISSGLKISDEFKEREFAYLSGGEKTTVILGKILLQNPDVLLLDEPSNHLDIESVEWLEEYLKDYKGTVLIISHDRYFLDMVATKVIEVEDMETELYLGNYSYYVEEKERRLLEQYEAYQTQQKKIKAMEEAIKRFRDWGTRADNEKMFIKARNMQKRIDRMEKIDRPMLERKKIQLDFDVNQRSGRDVIRVKDLRKSFGDNLIFRDIDLHIRYSEKVAILGKNGCGKSTLIKILLGEQMVDGGNVEIVSSAKIGYLDQNVEFENENHTVIEALRDKHVMPEGKARGILAGFLFYSDDVFKKVADLSGGERSRLKLCLLMQEDINLLILDEPTNHLDIDSREMLEEALQDFEGTILFVSHDRYFINKIAKRITEIRNREIFNYVGNYDYFRRKKSEEVQKESGKIRTPETKKTNHIQKNIKSKPPVSKKEYAVKIEKLEEEIEALEKLLGVKEKELEEHSTDYEKLNEIYQEKNQIETELNLLLEKWTELSSGC